MKKIIDSLKYIHLKDLLSPFIFIFILPFALIFRLFNKIRKKELWLICESGNTARDNGYHFFKYVRENYPNDYCFYVIDKNCCDYQKVKRYGNIIQFKSFKHWLYYLSAKYNISNQKNGNPNQVFFYFIHVSLGLYKNRVFLQHGITKDNSLWLYYKNTKFKYFICGAKKEYDYIKEKFGYPDGNVIYTGFPRFDNLYNNNVNKKQILIMPTWRNWLGREMNSFGQQFNFLNTDYFKNWNGLLTDSEFIKYIEDNNYIVYFYPHLNMQKFLNSFRTDSSNIKILDNSLYDIQDLLKDSQLLITDYSSVYMDFAYMKKPIIYFQFDYEEYRKKQYQEGYFDYYRDGFGPVVSNKKELIESTKVYMKIGLEDKYLKRINNFFENFSPDSSSKIYQILKQK